MTKKTNHETATLRKENRYKPEKVRVVDKDANKGAAIKAARKQNVSDGKPYPKGRNVIENFS